MEHKYIFETFGTVHVATVAVLVALGAVLLYFTRTRLSRASARRTGAAFALVMLVQEVFDRGWHIAVGDDFWGHLLPLQMCGASVFLVIALLLWHKRLIFELVFFWGLGGASVALITPDVAYPFPHPLYISYFTSHAMIVIGVLYMMVNFGYRPTLRSLGGTVVFSNGYLLLVFPLNHYLGTNFLYVSEKPEAMTLLDALGPWPWYILGMEAIALFIFCGLYTPYLIADLLKTGSVFPKPPDKEA